MNDIAQVSFINVDQGDCTFIKAPGDCDILIDGGGKEGDFSVAENTIKPYLLQNGVYDIEYAIVSHGHIDHIGGIIGLIDVFPVETLVVPTGFGTTEEGKTLINKAEEHHISIQYLAHGKTIDFQNGMTLYTILPNAESVEHNVKENENNQSAVFKITYGNTSILFTGDIEQETENLAVEKYGTLLSADILKVPHHGSKTSNNERFIDCVSPRYSVITVGKNTYGHPHENTLETLRKRNSIIFRTDTHRDITFYIAPEKIKGIKTTETGVLR